MDRIKNTPIPNPCLLVAALAAALILALPPAIVAKEPKLTWKAATLAPKRVGWANQVAEIVLPAIEKASDGEMAVKVYWGGVMGGDEDVLAKMREGSLQVAGFAGQGAVLACPETAVLELPFLFNNYDEVDFIREKLHPVFEDLARKHSLVLFLWIDQDFDQVYSSGKPLARLEDFRGVRFINWYGPVERAVLEKLGAMPVPLSVPDVSEAIRQGKAEGNIGPALWMVGAQLYSVFHCFNTMNIRYSPALIMITAKAWDSMPLEWSAKLWSSRMDLTRRFTAKTRKDNKAALAAMVQYGVQEARSGPEDLAAIRKALVPVWDELAGSYYPRDLLDRLREDLARFRSR